MATSRWKITEWNPGSLCPVDGFLVGGELILKVEPDSYSLVWVNTKSETSSMDGLPKLMGGSVKQQVPVHFGPSSIPCDITLQLSEKRLAGTLKPRSPGKPGSDGEAGTFTAEASGPPPPDPVGKEGQG